jgi:L-asparaginase II
MTTPATDAHLRPENPAPAGTAALARVTRSGRVESWHRGALVVIENGAVVFAVGDPDQMVYARSAVKPLQALPLLERGVAARLQLSTRELALVSASHNGTPQHVDVATGLLAKGGFTAEDLRCGPHLPFDKQAALAIAKNGGKARKPHNNCSGKHAGFLLLAQELGVDSSRYLDPGGDSQELVKQTVAAMADVDPTQVETGLDGCGAPSFWMPLSGIARAFARLTNPDGLDPVRAQACRTMLDAVTREPVLLAGEGRLCTALVRALPGKVYPKNGAEGIYAVGLPGRNIGMAIKVADGQERGYLPVVVDALRALGMFDEVPDSLRDFHRVPIYNTQKRHVGDVTCAVAWPW